MFYENLITGEFGIPFETAKRLAGVSAPEGAMVIGSFHAYLFSPVPQYNEITQKVVEVRPVGGVQQWVVEDLSEAEAAQNLANARSRQWEKIKALRDAKIQTGGYAVAGKWFHSDTFSRTQQIGLVMMGENTPPDLHWKTMDGSFVIMTPTLAQQVFSAAAAQDNALFTHAEVLRAQVNSSQNPLSIDITTGWPATFTG